MKKQQLPCNRLLNYVTNDLKALDEEVSNLCREYIGKLVRLKDNTGHETDGYVNNIRLAYLSHEYWFHDDDMHFVILWDISPLRTFNGGGAFVSSHHDSFYNPTTITEVKNWKNLSNIQHI